MKDKKIEKKKFKEMVNANLKATEAMVRALEGNPEKPKDELEKAAWKARWHATSQRSRASLEDGTAQCPCGKKDYLSNFFPTFGDHNWYCSECITAMIALLCADSSDDRPITQKYGEPGDLWNRTQN
jgi:hypothetical protein